MLLPIALMLIGFCAPFVLVIRANFGDLPPYAGPCFFLAYLGGICGAFMLAHRIFTGR